MSGLTMTPPLNAEIGVVRPSGSISIDMPRGGRPLVTANAIPVSPRRLTAGAARAVPAFSPGTGLPSTSPSTVPTGDSDVGLSFLSALQLAIATDQRVRGRVVLELGLGVALQLRDDRARQNLAELDPPLVEGVDTPDGALREHVVLVQRHQRSEHR